MPDHELPPGDAVNPTQKRITALTLNLHPLRPDGTLAAYGLIYKFKSKFKP
ncbi:MAG TPA: hypothetical protein VF528_06975 [Pyrinomonadaceae bacterium]